jgi:hypothetical protein
MNILAVVLLDLLARMSAVNPNLHSYQATMHAHVALATFPFLSTDVVATVYHKDPDLNKIAVTSGLPGLAEGFSQLYPRIEPPARWQSLYTVTMGSDDGTTTHIVLVPKAEGNVQKIEVGVDDATATVRTARWEYANGGSASLEQHYSSIQGNLLATSQSGHVDEPNYKGDISATLSGYELNPDLPDSLFSQ